MNDASLWSICALIIAVAIIGKFLGTSLSARLMGQSWYNSFTIGTLMNTRGLMELVVLNIGYDLGILSPTLFSMFVLMALVTTFITGPALDAISGIRYQVSGISKKPTNISYQPSAISNQQPMSVLISFGQPKAGARLLQLADELCWTISDFGFRISENKNKKPSAISHELSANDNNPKSEIRNPKSNITALHLTPSADISITEANIFEKEGFAPILDQASERGIQINTHYKATNNLNNEIIRFANAGNFDMMLVGSSRPLFSDDETGGKVHEFFAGVNCPIGVLVDRGFETIKKVLIIEKENILDISVLLNNYSKKENARFTKIENTDLISENLISNFDLLIVNLTAWEEIKLNHKNILDTLPTVLIIGSS